ncbi:hypothetical protein DH2020_004289 [Rehmannia glutinosa]|uniref:Protein MIZU-KUSSEI 1 n=1 Tax=Rehmannia glutinosa TaxID=99300 RepID=A0ABR0XP08_REHGL
MRTMIHLGSGQRGPLHIIDTATSVECGREVRFRRSFRTLVECMVPLVAPFLPPPPPTRSPATPTPSPAPSSATVKAAESASASKTTSEFAVPTSYLAREMQYGLLRIALECDRRRHKDCSLYDVPVWCLYCNGRKVGFAIRRQMTTADTTVLKLMQSVSVGAGVLPKPEDDGDLLYLRATFDRVIGSADSESFHMINPVGSSGQELSAHFVFE